MFFTLVLASSIVFLFAQFVWFAAIDLFHSYRLRDPFSRRLLAHLKNVHLLVGADMLDPVIAQGGIVIADVGGVNSGLSGWRRSWRA